MVTLISVRFKSIYKIDNESDKIEFCAKGYKKIEDNKTIIYFKHEHAYKFIIDGNNLEVNVDSSVYKFDVKTKTEAIISSDGYSYKASVITKDLIILDDVIELTYQLDFANFKGDYQITLELL